MEEEKTSQKPNNKAIVILLIMNLALMVLVIIVFSFQKNKISDLETKQVIMTKQYMSMLNYINDCQNNGGMFTINIQLGEGYCNIKGQSDYGMQIGMEN